jgi:hypothetical protein
MTKKILKLLYRSFDEELSLVEQQQLEVGLKKSEQLLLEKQKIQELRAILSGNAKESFQPFFAEKVMHRIRTDGSISEQIFFDSLVKIFRPVIITTTIIIISLVTYNLFTGDEISLKTALGEPNLSIEHVIDPAVNMSLTMEIIP